MQISRLELTNVIFVSTLVPKPADLSTRKYGQPSEICHSPPFCRRTWSQVSGKKSVALIHAFLQIRQTSWCLWFLTSGMNNCILYKAEKSHIWTNRRRLRMIGIMPPVLPLQALISGLGLRTFQALHFCCTDCTLTCGSFKYCDV
jgi:hypothetical protein